MNTKILVFTFLLINGFLFSQVKKPNSKPQTKGPVKNTAVQAKGLDRSIRPIASKPPEINIKDSEVFTTESGLTVVLSENHKLPKVSLNLVMNSTPELENQKAGLAQIAGELLLSGTNTRTKDALDSEIDYIGATITSTEKSIYLSCLKKHLPLAMTVYSDVIMNANFPQNEFDRIVKQAESNLMSDKSNPDKIADNVERKVNFEKHPYGEIMTEGTLKTLTRDDVVEYYKNKFTPNGSYLVIVGDINKEEAVTLVNNYFLTWKGNKKAKTDLGDGTFKKGNRIIFVKKPGAVQSTVTVTFPFKMKPGDMNQIPLTVTNGILGGGGFGTRLMQNLRENKAYTYGCYSSLNVTENGSWFSASGNFRNEVTDSAITQLLFELNRITNELVTDEELNLTKSTMAGSFARSLENPATVAKFALNIIQNNLQKDYYQTYLKRLDAVDKETVLAMAKQYLTAENCNIIVVGNEEIINKLKVFDADGKIEFLDAFAKEISAYKKADISEEDLFEKYILTLTNTPTDKEAKKIISKVKTMKQEYELKSAMFPGVMNMTNYFAIPNKEAMKMEMQGMLIQKTYFDGVKGGASSMQEGKTEMKAEEIAAKNKSIGLIPEMSYAITGMSYELLGILNENGKDFYVLKTKDGETEKLDYFEVSTFLKVKTIQIQEGQETTLVFGDFKPVNGIKFPHSINLSVAGMTLEGTTKLIEINGKMEDSVFE
jgi:zinc protease